MSGAWETVVLGIAQDGGVPHPGCSCARCDAAASGRSPRRHVACLGLTDGTRHVLFDATPDLPAQLRMLGTARPDALFLTHAHMGHVTGLVYLGREALGVRGVPLHGTPSMHAFLAANAPFRDLLTQGRVEARPADGVEFPGGVTVSAFLVPHRAEHTDTVGYRIEGPNRTVLFLPDIDSWDAWDCDVREVVTGVDVAYLDATFYSAAELPNRDPSEIPHPPVVDTMERLADVADRVRFIHLNHTNPLLDDPSPATERGFHVAVEGERVRI